MAGSGWRESQHALFGKHGRDPAGQQVSRDGRPQPLERTRVATGIQRRGKERQAFAPVAPVHEVAVAVLVAHQDVPGTWGVAMVVEHGRVLAREHRCQNIRARGGLTMPGEPRPVEHESRRRIEVSKAQALVQGRNDSAGREVGEDPILLAEQSAQQAQGVRPVILQDTERREVAQTDRPVTANRVDADIDTDDAMVAVQQLETLIRPDHPPRRVQQRRPSMRWNTWVQVFMEEGGDQFDVVGTDGYHRHLGHLGSDLVLRQR